MSGVALTHSTSIDDRRFRDAFTAANPMLLDAKVMLTHYSTNLLVSPEARARFVEPDVQRILTG